LSNAAPLADANYWERLKMTKVSSPEYLAKVKTLSKDETERLLSRMTGKLPRRLEKDKLSREEALAIQLELEDEQLKEWRNMMQELKKKDEAKAVAKSAVAAKTAVKPKAKTKTSSQPRAAVQTKNAVKAKGVVKSKTKTEPKTDK
jgi:hypothetical protein